MDNANQLRLLLVLQARSPSRLALDQDTLQHTHRPQLLAGTHLRADGGDPNNLALQGWAVLAPAGGRGQRLCDLIAPLVERRSQQQGRAARVYQVPQPADPAMDIDGALAWQAEHWRPAHQSPEDEPRYVLILGDLDEVPLAIQQMLSIRAMVGRLAFEDDQGYQAYVAKVLAWEEHAATAKAPANADAVLYTVHDGAAGSLGASNRAVQQGFDGLIRPIGDMLASLQAPRPGTAWHLRQLRLAGSASAPAPDQFVAIADTAHPTVLLSLSHGQGIAAGTAGAGAHAGNGHDHQRRLQGAMHFASADPLTGADLANVRFLPGGVWFMQACFSAGTPATSAYYPWLALLKQHGYQRRDIEYVLACLPGPGGRPFISAMAKAVLANPQGPLAFIGHIDLAWTYSFNDLHRHCGGRHRRLGDALMPLFAGARVGNSLAALIGHFNEVQTELECDWARAARPGTKLRGAAGTRAGRLWMLRQDLFAYLLLGDPAARLPLARPRPGPPTGSDSAWLATLERAINKVLSRGGTVRQQDVRAVSYKVRRLGLSSDELRHFIDVYRNAGLAAVDKELKPHE